MQQSRTNLRMTACNLSSRIIKVCFRNTDRNKLGVYFHFDILCELIAVLDAHLWFMKTLHDVDRECSMKEKRFKQIRQPFLSHKAGRCTTCAKAKT